MTEQPAHNAIEIEGARARNLKNVSVTIPLNRWTAVVGMSGSGKSSLVFETIHAESQRRFFETLPHGIRVWLEQWERPDADRISHLPASLAIGRNQQPQTGITRISQTSGLEEELIRIMIAQGELVCPACQLGVRSSSVEQVLQAVEKLPAGVRYQIGFPVVLREQAGSPISPQQIAAEKAFWEQTGYSRFLAVQADPALQHVFQGERFVVVVDRLQSGQADLSRIRESIEQSLTAGLGHCLVLVDHTDLPGFDRAGWLLSCQDESGLSFRGLAFSHGRECPACLTSVPEMQPELFWGGRTHGNCGQCSGEGIIKLKDAQEICPECSGTGLGVIALHARLANETGTRLTFAELLQQRIETLPSTLESVLADRSPHDSAFRNLLKTVDQLVDLGLGPLRLNRLTRTLSRGEFQKVSLISACRQQFVNTLILLEEICNGLHPEDRAKVSGWIRNLVSTGNTVITVEHHADVIAAADHVIELGPEAGVSGGEVVYTGSPEKYLQKLQSFEEPPERRIAQAGESLEIRDVHLNSLQGVSVRFPLNRFIVVSGVCSSGKTSLICQALSLAVNDRLADRNSTVPSAVKDPFQPTAQVGAIVGGEEIDECLVMTASNWTGSSRSTPATYLKVFDEIRKLFAESVDAQKAGFKPSHFSFNSSSGGRCQRCRGRGEIEVDLQFLANLCVTCPECHGRRYAPETLLVFYRNRNIHDVLQMTAEEAFAFFRNHPKIQRPLQLLRDVGLGYVTLGQPTASFSMGECQRLMLASSLSAASGKHRLYLFDEPASGLHPADLMVLVRAFQRLVEQGHSVVVIENDPQILSQADWIIEMGPGAHEKGGTVVYSGPPENWSGSV